MFKFVSMTKLSEAIAQEMVNDWGAGAEWWPVPNTALRPAFCNIDLGGDVYVTIIPYWRRIEVVYCSHTENYADLNLDHAKQMFAEAYFKVTFKQFGINERTIANNLSSRTAVSTR